MSTKPIKELSWYEIKKLNIRRLIQVIESQIEQVDYFHQLQKQQLSPMRNELYLCCQHRILNRIERTTRILRSKIAE